MTKYGILACALLAASAGGAFAQGAPSNNEGPAASQASVSTGSQASGAAADRSNNPDGSASSAAAAPRRASAKQSNNGR